jgi:hypothetical protein
VKKRRRKQFFFEKKNQKTFAPLRAHLPPSGVTSKNQSFFASFCSQKEVLPAFFIPPSAHHRVNRNFSKLLVFKTQHLIPIPCPDSPLMLHVEHS